MAPADPTQFSAHRRAETAACVAIALLAGWFYFWSIDQPNRVGTYGARYPNGYYALQAAGYRSGHLYLALDPHPALLALKDPYDPVANAPYRVHDLSLFAGHYYMYFGATPAVLFFWPFAALTGFYPTDQCAVALFCTAAVWVGIALLVSVRRRHFPAAPSLALVLAAACIAFATPLTTLVEGAQFYQVPISCAILLQALMLAAGYASMNSSHRGRWLACAGLMLGLSLGARPNYLLGTLALLVPVWFASARSGERRLKALLRYSACTFLPTFACGLALLAYNHARFGTLSEFGMHYQLAGERVTNLQAISPAFILPHYRNYLLGHGVWQSYFPFFGPTSGEPFGVWRYIPWTWLLVVAFSGAAANSARRSLALMVAVCSWANLTMLSCFFGTTARYPGDFAQAMLLLAGIGALSLGERAIQSGRRGLAAGVMVVLATVSLIVTSAVYFSGSPDPGSLVALGRFVNKPFYAWQRMHHEEFGGLQVDLRLPKSSPSEAEPIFETGRQPDQRDWLQIEYTGANKARLGFFHAGTGVFESKEFEVPANREITVKVTAGSLFPPFAFPAFEGWSRDEYASARRRLQVDVNGVHELDMALDCYESSPSDLRVGRMGWFTGGMAQRFSGDVLAVKRLPINRPAPSVAQFRSAAPIELTVYMPSGKSGGADPILVSGSGDKSDLVYCIYDGMNRVKFAFDHWGNGGPQSELVPFDPLVPHKITVLDEAVAGLSKGRLAVVFDGKPLINITQIFYPSSPDTVMLGYNKFGSTGAGRQFTGTIVSSRQVSADSIPVPAASGTYGAVEMSVIFPLDVLGTNEPLVVTGETGAGDFLYVRYLDSSHISIGFDHWAIGGEVSPPIEINYGETHHISMTMGSLFPEGSAERQSRRLLVELDGKPVLSDTRDTYSSAPAAIEIAANKIGGSTCGPLFTGRILSTERH